MSRLGRRAIEVTTIDELPHTIIDGDNTYTVTAIINWWGWRLAPGGKMNPHEPCIAYRRRSGICLIWSSAAVSGRFTEYGIKKRRPQQ